MEVLLSVNNSSYLIEITSLIIFFSHQWLIFILIILFSVQNYHPLVFNYRDAPIDFSLLDFNSQLKNYSFSPVKLYSVASSSSFKKLCESKYRKIKLTNRTVQLYEAVAK